MLVLVTAVLALASCGQTTCQNGHSFDTSKYEYDDTNHWYKCSACGAKDSVEAHSMTSGKCQTCGYSSSGIDYSTVTVMDQDTRYNFVVANTVDEIAYEIKTVTALMGDLNKKGFKFFRTYSDEEVAEQEIVVGYDANRDISRRAYDFLNRLDKKSYFDMRYVVYADSGSIGIAYELNKYTDISVMDFIYDEIIIKLVGNKDYIAVERGVVMQGSIDLIAEQEKLDDIQEAEQWAMVEANLVNKWGAEKGAEFLESFKTLYSLYDDGLVVWAANLYDPGIGGFYATASGRDHEGIYPSPETTGMCLDMGGSFGAPGEIRELIPDIMKYQIIYYLKSTQYEDGYFYPPGASRSVWQTSGVAARGRSLSRAESLFRSYGALPQYPTINLSGDKKTADEYWQDLRDRGLVDQDPPKVPQNIDDLTGTSTASLRTSSIVAVASIVNTSVIATAEVKNELNDYHLFINWLESNNVKAGPYGAGNTIQARLVEFQTASKTLEANVGKFQPDPSDSEKYTKYAGMNMVEIIYAYLESCINPKTGIWGEPNDRNPKGTEFAYTNGFFKIIAIYNAIRRPVPYPVEAAQALMEGTISKEGTSNNACDVYNIWAGITMLQTNVKSYQPDKSITEATLNKIDELLVEYGDLPIITSYNKQKGYQKADGSFSHSTAGSAETYQGPLKVGLGYNEGDIDAIAKALWSTIGPIITLYGANGKKGFYLHNYMEYMQILLENGPVIKYSYAELEAGVTYVPNNRLPGPSYANAIPDSSTASTSVTPVSNELVCVPSFNTDYSSSGKKQTYAA